jgi:hypothetical protein
MRHPISVFILNTLTHTRTLWFAVCSLDRRATPTSKPVAVELLQRCEQAVYRPSEDQKQTGSTGKAKKSRLCF